MIAVEIVFWLAALAIVYTYFLYPVVLMALIFYGVATGQLGHMNPWDPGPAPQATQDSPSARPEPIAPPGG